MQLLSAGCERSSSSSSGVHGVEVVKGWWCWGWWCAWWGLLLIHFPGCRSSSGKPQAVSSRLLLPYHNGMTNGAVKILEVQRPSLLLSKQPELQGRKGAGGGWGWGFTAQLSKLCITDGSDANRTCPVFLWHRAHFDTIPPFTLD